MHSNPVDAADVTVIDVKDSEDDGIKQEQSEELGHKSTLEIIDDLKPATEGYSPATVLFNNNVTLT